LVVYSQEASQLEDDDDKGDGMVTVRLRLTDKVDSFSGILAIDCCVDFANSLLGFVCETSLLNDLTQGVVISISSVQVESLGGNK
jgi:hypothetical protein